MFAGYRTYIVAGAMVMYAVSSYVLGKDADLDLRMILEGLGLAALRKGVADK